MNSTWQKTKLKDSVELLTGFAFKSNCFSEKEDDIPLVKGENLHQGYIDWKNAKKWNREEYQLFAKYHLEEGDIVLAMDRPWIEAGLKFAWIKKHDPAALLVQRVSRLRGTKKLLTKYLRYIVGSPHFTAYLKNIATGINVPHISGPQILDYKVNLPPLPTQKKIAAILSAYDDLIENNNQRIRLLEEVAEEIYKEWFVRLRFPGYQEATFRDKDGKVVPHGTVGALPEGWDNGRLSVFTSIIKRGISPTYDENGETYVLNQRCIRDNRINSKLARRQSKKIAKEKFIQFGDVLVNSTGEGTLGRVAQVQEDYKGWSVDSHVTIIRPSSKVDLNYFGTALMNKQVIFESLAFGSTGQTELGREDVQKMRLIMPNRELQDMFGNLISPMRKEINILLQKNQILRETRDLLLPRLISGKLRVDNLDLDVITK